MSDTMIDFWTEYEGLINKEEHLQHIRNQLEQIVQSKEQLGEHYVRVFTMMLMSYFDDLLEYARSYEQLN